LIVDECKFGK